jgi:hypothetical protein
MRLLALALVLLAAPALAADVPSPRPRTDIDLVLPLPPTEHQRLQFFGGRDHHLVPGTATIDGSPYLCDVDHLGFRDREAFVAHLRTVHRTPTEEIPGSLVIVDGRVHFVGR